MKKKILTLCLIFFVTFVLLMGAYSLYVRNEILNSKNIYQYIAKDKADHIITTVNNVILRTGVMNALIQDHNGGTEFFDAMADNIYDDVLTQTGIKLEYIAIAPEGVVSDVFPYEGNENLLGFDLLDVTKPGNIQSRDAYNDGLTVLTHYFDIKTNGIGITDGSGE